MYALEKSKFGNSNDACIIILMPKVKIERIIVFMRDRELAFFKKGMFQEGKFQSSSVFVVVRCL